MSTAAAVAVLLDRIEQHMATANNLRAGREKAFADREAMRAERDACHKAARHAEAEAAELRRKLEEAEATLIKHYARALEAEGKVQVYFTSLREHRAELAKRKNAHFPKLPPTYGSDEIPF